MTSDSPELRPTPLRSRREATIQVLCDQFAKDNLSLEEFERRLDVAHRATALTELEALTADLQEAAPAAPAPKAVARPQQAAPSEIREQQTLVAIMGGVERGGQWVPARQTQLFALMGGAQLDFREARLGAVTEITVVCFMGGVEIIVPPGLIVDVSGTAIMGGFEQPRASGEPIPGAPVLKVNGFVMMGGVEVSERERGESARDARKRRRSERKNRRPGGSG